MTATASIQVKMIAALLEAIDADDKADAEQAVKMIRSLLESGEKKS
jgi:hypothetical protein